MTSGVKEKYDALIEQGLFVQKRWGQPRMWENVSAALAMGSFPYSTGRFLWWTEGLLSTVIMNEWMPVQ
jgi:hypothetical protein